MSTPTEAETVVMLVAVIVAVLAVWRARSMARRLRSLTSPLHELRGSLSALELGLESVRRRAVWSRALDGRLEGVRIQLDRANFALADLERLRLGERGWVEQRHETFDLEQLVFRKVRGWSEVASAYGATVDADWRAGAVAIRGDSGRLGQALDNLISNALEHGGGHVHVRGEWRASGARITVADSGPGFERALERPRGASWRSPRGHGLAIARQGIASHGGSLTTEGGESGTVMVLDLPAEEAARGWGRQAVRPNGVPARGHDRPVAANGTTAKGGRARAETNAA